MTPDPQQEYIITEEMVQKLIGSGGYNRNWLCSRPLATHDSLIRDDLVRRIITVVDVEFAMDYNQKQKNLVGKIVARIANFYGDFVCLSAHDAQIAQAATLAEKQRWIDTLSNLISTESKRKDKEHVGMVYSYRIAQIIESLRIQEQPK